MAQNMGLKAKIKSLEDSEQNLQTFGKKKFGTLLYHFLKLVEVKKNISEKSCLSGWPNMFLKHARNPMFLGMGNHLEPFAKVSEPPEGQEQGGGAVGGQGRLHGVKL